MFAAIVKYALNTINMHLVDTLRTPFLDIAALQAMQQCSACGSTPTLWGWQAGPLMKMQITTTNQTTAEVGQEPLRELRSFRSGALLNWVPEPWWRNEVYLGWHTVRSGMDLTSGFAGNCPQSGRRPQLLLSF